MTQKLTLRPYQTKALDEIRAHYAAGRKRVLLHLATGGGKTLTFCRILESAHKKGKRAIMVVKGIELVENASRRLSREGVPHGVLQGKHWRNRPNEPIQVCSVDTLYRRKVVPDADICVWDEAHFCVSPSYRWLIDNYKEAFHLAVTATPHVKEGLRHLADEVVYPISIGQLIDQGYLARPRYFAPSRIEVTGVKTDRTGDYNNMQLFSAADHSGIYGDIVSSYRRFLDGRSAVCFAVNVEHSKRIAAAFNRAGIVAEHIDADTPPAERELVLSRVESGETKIVTNCAILLVGVDMPYIGGVIMARPTKSYNLHIQAIGRGTRIHGEKKEFIVLDHAGNIARHGLIEDEISCELDGQKKKTDENGLPVITCEICFAAYSTQHVFETERSKFDADEPYVAHWNAYDPLDDLGTRSIKSKRLNVCPACGANNTKQGIERSTEELQDELKEITPEQRQHLKILARQKELKAIQKARNYRRGWIWNTLKDEFGEEIASQYEKKRNIPDWVKRKNGWG